MTMSLVDVVLDMEFGIYIWICYIGSRNSAVVIQWMSVFLASNFYIKNDTSFYHQEIIFGERLKLLYFYVFFNALLLHFYVQWI